MSNIENTDTRSIYDLSYFGRAMKNYAIAKIIWTCFMIIIGVFLESPIEDLASLTEEEITENAGPLLLLSLFVIFGFVIGGIYRIVRYLVYLLKLNKASNSPVGAPLRTNFYIEMLVLITYIINAFLIVPKKIYVDLVSISLLIAFTVYLGKWVISLSNQGIDENKKNQMLFWIRIMMFGLIVKLGEILRLFSSPSLDYAGMILFYVGDIILAVGMLKTAKELMNTFNRGISNAQIEYSNTLRNRGPVQRPQHETGQYPSQSFTATSTVTSSVSNDICPYCGSPIVDPNTKFCSVCGKKMD